jgi:preprotein translocase subunit SecG
MKTFILILQILACLGLISTVLLQSGKSAGLGSISGGAENLFGSKKGMDELFSKLSSVSAVAFILLTLLLSIV